MQIYVGTYHKYNCGSIAGKWLDPEDYSNKEEFLEACHELHKDEEDPEFMFQDYEDIPEALISESHIDERLWDEFIPLDQDERDLVAAYWDNIFGGEDLHTIEDRSRGKWDSFRDYVEDYIEQCYDLQSMGDLAYYLDYDAIARDWKGDYSIIECSGGGVFVFSDN